MRPVGGMPRNGASKRPMRCPPSRRPRCGPQADGSRRQRRCRSAAGPRTSRSGTDAQNAVATASRCRAPLRSGATGVAPWWRAPHPASVWRPAVALAEAGAAVTLMARRADALAALAQEIAGAGEGETPAPRPHRPHGGGGGGGRARPVRRPGELGRPRTVQPSSREGAGRLRRSVRSQRQGGLLSGARGGKGSDRRRPPRQHRDHLVADGAGGRPGSRRLLREKARGRGDDQGDGAGMGPSGVRVNTICPTSSDTPLAEPTLSPRTGWPGSKARSHWAGSARSRT